LIHFWRRVVGKEKRICKIFIIMNSHKRSKPSRASQAGRRLSCLSISHSHLILFPRPFPYTLALQIINMLLSLFLAPKMTPVCSFVVVNRRILFVSFLSSTIYVHSSSVFMFIAHCEDVSPHSDQLDLLALGKAPAAAAAATAASLILLRFSKLLNAPKHLSKPCSSLAQKR